MQSSYYFASPLVSIAWVLGVAVVVSVVSVTILLRRGAGRSVIAERLELVWLSTALGAVAVLTLQPGPGGFDSALAPILDPAAKVTLSGAAANVALYVPVGFFAAVLWHRKAQPIAWATGLAFSVSLGIELAQWLLPISRSFQTQDLLLNTLGGFIGAALGTFAMQHLRRAGGPIPRDMSVAD
mgnify:CR=1 FL=1